MHTRQHNKKNEIYVRHLKQIEKNRQNKNTKNIFEIEKNGLKSKHEKTHITKENGNKHIIEIKTTPTKWGK